MTISKRQAWLGLLAATTIGLAACGGDETQAPPPSRQSVTAATVTLTPLDRVVTASGSVSAWEEVPVGAETGGLVATGVFVDEGQYVRQGQVLVKLNDDLLRAQLRQQDAALASAEATLAQQEAALARAGELRERGFLSQASLDTAIANQRTAQANVAAARASRSETATRLDQTNLRAPVSGLIISRSVTRGQIVQPGTELFRVVRDGRLELDAQVPETELPMVRPGMAVAITSDQAGQTSGTVRIVTPEVDPQTRLGVARVTLASGSGLRPGMFARATIAVGVAPVLTVPSDAIVFREGKAGVYVIGPNDAVRFVEVTTGARSGNLVSIPTGLSAGQRVVVQGAGFLGEGDLVTVRAAGTTSASAPTAASAGAAQR
ncbi:efflux RND transporter periplasmic adaptor subunit [Brevundimonas sp.]|uniref:efflux RND transporter periplasmic adaptor subunit n=1 Tax=Brevundimonas sp. TaxID=1871086 RepID=UPI002AB9DDD9|nr:efflux RND transporter periplasmic adaptor subunit [Brevundimonas sp.]MDZ4364930.1 efflux RND transporter periplasmic adaptor subunit [Brevundimonas sp.]